MLLLQLLTTFAIFFKFGSTLRCYVCDSEKECADPAPQLCPPNNECFVVADSYDQKSNGLKKGCTTTCDIANMYGKICRTCRGNLCNAKQGLGAAFDKPKPLPPRGPFGPRKPNSGNDVKPTCIIAALSIGLFVNRFLLNFSI